MEISDLTKYISVWMWMVISIQFLIGALVTFALERTLISQSLYVAFFLLFVVSLITSMAKRKQFFEDLNQEED